MIAFSKLQDGIIPCFLFLGIVALIVSRNVSNQHGDLVLVLVLIVVSIKRRAYLSHVRQRPVSFRKIEHLTLNF